MVLCWSLFLLACTLCGVFNCSHSFKITQGSCEPLPSTTFCHDIEWSNTSLPNVRGQSNPQCINSELNHFLPLVQTQCSNATVVFLCSVYLPYCSNTNKLGEIVVLMPCRDVCERVLGGCQWLFQNNSLSWPPHLDCQNFPTAQPCFTVPGLESVVNIPSHLLTDSSNSLYQIQHDRTTSPTAIPNTILLTAMPNTILSTAIPNTISTTSHYPLSSSLVLYTTSNDSSANYTSNIINNNSAGSLLHSSQLMVSMTSELISSPIASQQLNIITMFPTMLDSDLPPYPTATVTIATDKLSSTVVNVPLSLPIILVYGFVIVLIVS